MPEIRTSPTQNRTFINGFLKWSWSIWTGAERDLITSGKYGNVAEEEDPYEFQKELEQAKTFSFSDFKEFGVSDEAEWIEPTMDAKTFNLDEVKDTIKVQGYDLKEPPKPAKDAEKKALARADPTADFKRNREAYGIMCPICKDTKKCQACHGRGRIKLFFKCKECMGTGKCQDCDREIEIHCPQCDKPISKFTSTCTKCGLLIKCPVCSSPLPAMATKCMMCRAEFKCKVCRKPIPKAYTWRCPHCNHWNE
jgi:hypothetical protein